MTTKETNRDIKRLWNKRLSMLNTDEYFKYIDGEYKKEFLRLYRADSKAEYINYNSFRAMHRMNQCHRFINSAFFYINLEV